jgi:hypothetical protein
VTNLVPERYRGVSVTRVPAEVALDGPGLGGYLVGRPAYRRTRFVVARAGRDTALARVTRADEDELFSPVRTVELLAGPAECAYVLEPDVDTGIPSALAEVALARAPGRRAVVVQGRYAHVNFILDPHPLRISVRDVVPPEPAKLLDQARRVLAVAETLPPIELVGQLTDLTALARTAPAAHYLLPCRGSGAEVPGARVSYLDEHPERADWTLLGCARSRQIHRWFYGDEPPCVDFCPRRAPGPGTLTKCCLQEERVEAGDGWASVPWGASLDQVRAALTLLAERLEPGWAPG